MKKQIKKREQRNGQLVEVVYEEKVVNQLPKASVIRDALSLYFDSQDDLNDAVQAVEQALSSISPPQMV